MLLGDSLGVHFQSLPTKVACTLFLFISTKALISNVKTEKSVHVIVMHSKFSVNLCLQTNRAGSGIMNLGGSLTRQVYVQARCKTNNLYKM